MAFFKRKKEKNNNTEIIIPERKLLSYQIGNLQGIGRRNRQEDSFTIVNAFNVSSIIEEGLMFVVCDGMGGMKDGKVASETAISSLRESFKQLDRNCDLSPQLRNSAYLASTAVENALDGYGGSTLVVGILFKEQLYYASVGDSGLYLKRGNGLYKINSTHNLCFELYAKQLETGELDPIGCREAEEANALTSFLGMQGMNLIDGNIRPFQIYNGDILIACSDGVSGVLSENELFEALCENDPQSSCKYIEQKINSYANANQDNYTAIIIKCAY